MVIKVFVPLTVPAFRQQNSPAAIDRRSQAQCYIPQPPRRSKDRKYIGNHYDRSSHIADVQGVNTQVDYASEDIGLNLVNQGTLK